MYIGVKHHDYCSNKSGYPLYYTLLHNKAKQGLNQQPQRKTSRPLFASKKERFLRQIEVDTGHEAFLCEVNHQVGIGNGKSDGAAPEWLN